MNKEKIKKLNKIGQDITFCDSNCAGINRIPNKGIIPRCFYIETDKRDIKSEGCIIVGINPGMGNEKSLERKHYMAVDLSYNEVVKFWENPVDENGKSAKKKGRNRAYYTRLRLVAKLLGIKGPIIWTELAKCENLEKGKLPPLQTFRNCTGKFLNEELKIIDNDWIIIAVGREVHKALSYLYPEKSIFGISHPTGGRGGHFQKIMSKEYGHIIKSKVNEFKDNRGKEIWLYDSIRELVKKN